MSFLTRDRISLIAGGTAAAMLTAAALIASTSAANAATVGEAAPAFTELDTAGKPVSLADFAGKTVVLEWTNDGCPFVQKHYSSGNMQQTQAAAQADGVVWITVISSKPGSQGYATGAKADQLTTSRGAKPTHVLLDPDGSMGRAYGAKTTPHMYVVTNKGQLAYNGAIDSIQSSNVKDISKATNYVTAALEAVEAGKAPDPALTVPYGCGVKY
ncbi:MAG: redoxin family protein [Alphaproteobacteria bacterium]|nr:redoxin family protein [Alphaproteobacteria bacterium]